MPKIERELLDTKRHSVSHLLAMAVKKIYPQAKLGIGPTIENGFYYDFLNLSLKEKDLPKLEREIKNLVKAGIKFSKKEISSKEAKKIFQNEPLKLELINELIKKGDKISIYESEPITPKVKKAYLTTKDLSHSTQIQTLEEDKFKDLCAGPHIKSTKEINYQNIKLLGLAGAYWKGKETNPMLLRVYGTYFDKEKDLKKYLETLEEAKARNHKILGKQLGIFGIYPKTIGSGLILWQPNGSIIRKEIEDFWKEVHQQNNYQLVYSPHLGKIELWKKSGHFGHYKEMMYAPIKMPDETYILKPMNCPFHIQIYSSQQRSYKDLPLKLAELGTVYRYEKKGVLLGLLRVRGFTQDDAHIFCTFDQLEKEITQVYNLSLKMLEVFGFKKFEIELALRDSENKKGYIGENQAWQKAETALRNILKKKKVKFKEGIGEAKFYGPSIDIKMLDALNRAWQGPTIQVDLNLPKKFNLYFINQKGAKEQPIMIHRTVLGSMERFIANLIEQYAGAFPVWLSPIQIALIPVNEKFTKLAEKIALELKEFRLKIFEAKETVSKRIAEAEKQKIPYILVLGEKEKKLFDKKTPLSIRIRGGEIKNMNLEKFKEMLAENIKNKSLDL